jgi:hypothetical protein
VARGGFSFEDVLRRQVDRQNDRGRERQRQVEPHLLVPDEDASASAQECGIHESEVGPRQEHEQDHGPLRCGAERLERARLGSEAAGRERREAVRDCAVKIHALVQPH